MSKSMLAAAAATVALICATESHANLLGTSMTLTVTHTGVAGGLVGPAVLNHTYGGAPSMFNNQFFGSFLAASPAVAPGYDNAVMLDFTLFNYSGFANSMGTVAITSIDETVDASSLAILVNGNNVGQLMSATNDSLTASWNTNDVLAGSPQTPRLVIAWDSAVPAPGALALLGAAGVVGARRRRRAG